MSGTLLPNGKQQFLNSNGQPLAGGKVYFYIPSTTTFKNTYSDAALTNVNTNPIVLDANGQCVAWGQSGAYRQQVYDVNNNLIWDQETDAPASYTDITAAEAAVLAELAASTGSSLIGYNGGSTNEVTQTVQNKLQQIVSVLDFGAHGFIGYNASPTNSATQINNAIQYCSANNAVLDLAGLTYYITSELLINVSGLLIQNGTIVVDTTYSGNVFHFQSNSSTTSGGSENILSNIFIQTTQENNPSATNAQKEGQYTAILLDASNAGAIFNNRFDTINIKRPNYAVHWTGNNSGSFDTTNMFTNCSMLGFLICLYLDSTSSAVGQSFNSCFFDNQRFSSGVTSTTLVSIQNNIGEFQFNGCYVWQDGPYQFYPFNLPIAANDVNVEIVGGYWEIQSVYLANSMVSFSNVKITDKSYGSNPAIGFQPYISGEPSDNLIMTDTPNWSISPPGALTNPDAYWLGVPVYELTAGSVVYTVSNFAAYNQTSTDSTILTFSIWYKTNTNSAGYISIDAHYTDSTVQEFGSSYLIGDNSWHFIAVKNSGGFNSAKTLSNLTLTISSANSGMVTYLAGPCLNSSTIAPYFPKTINYQLPKDVVYYLTRGSSTPDVSQKYFYQTTNTAATTITNLLNGQVGQEVFVIAGDNNTTIQLTGSNIVGFNPTGSASDYQMLVNHAAKFTLGPNRKWYVEFM